MTDPGFFTVRTEGGLLPSAFLQGLAQSASGGGDAVPGLTPDAYHLIGNEKLHEAANRAWTRLLGAWEAYRKKLHRVPEGDPATTATREKWLLPLFQELGYGRLQTTEAEAFTVDGTSYPVSHAWGATPIHLLGSRIDLDTRTKGVAGAARSSPHSLVQELLNRSPAHLWAFLSNGRRLRILRDNLSLTRQAFVELDLESMMEGEIYSDFLLLYLLCHQSRVEADRPEDCWLERWTELARKQGTRALDAMREGVKKAIEALGRGFLSHRSNGALKASLRSGSLDKQEYYRQLLRWVYRLIFLFAAEDRDLLLVPEAPEEAKDRYREHYSTARLRRLAAQTKGGPHPDLWRALSLVAGKLSQPQGCPELALPALGSHLWEPEPTAALNDCELSNRHLLSAVWHLSLLEGKVRQNVDYKNLGPEELGSVYEALLEFQPRMNLEAGRFELEVVAGHERKTTGSYYTPTSLINALLDSALDPILDETESGSDPEHALLALKVCDPACGSGHFLIAAAHRIAKRLAAFRTGDDEPGPEATQHALRDVIAHSIYGVDVNPMALELCKVNLWLEALEPGKPLAFLDHHLQHGNSLIGATPALLREGIPNDAFKDLEGDDHETVLRYRKINRKERKDREDGQIALPLDTWDRLGDLGSELLAMEALDDDSLEDVHEKERRYREILDSTGYLQSRLWADAWCAAFVWRKVKNPERPQPITESVFRKIERRPQSIHPNQQAEIRRLAEKYQFFHWHLAFPEVFRVAGSNGEPENPEMGWSGGFDVVLGNPPWERVKIQEKEWFSGKHDEIVQASKAADRRKLIAALETEDPPLFDEFLEAQREAEGWSHFLRNSGRYPMTGVGDVNTYQVFAGLNRSLLGAQGRAGFIVPTGIATDHTTREFFQDLFESRSLVSLFDFQSGPGLWSEIGHARFKFSLLTVGGIEVQTEEAEFAFFLRSVTHLQDPERRFTLAAEDIALLNPNTGTCPIFKYRRDAEITKKIYREVPVLIEEGEPEKNPWQVDFLRMLDMANDSGLFRTRKQLEGEEQPWELEGNRFIQDDRVYLPLYEAKMVHHFHHRFGDYSDRPKGSRSTSLPDVPKDRLADPAYVPIPRYWVPREAVEERLEDRWDRGWLLGWRDICRSTDERTVIAGVIPSVGVGHKFPLFLPSNDGTPVFVGNLAAFVFDYAARQKVGGTSLAYFILKQLPVLEPSVAQGPTDWSSDETLNAWLTPRILELTYTAWDLEPFAQDCGYEGPPFRWDEARRFQLRCELDAAFFHLYGIERDDVDYVMETFPIVKGKDVKAYGDYRTKLVILDLYDRMQQAIDTGEPYQTVLDPPPADPSLAHPEETRPEWVG